MPWLDLSVIIPQECRMKLSRLVIPVVATTFLGAVQADANCPATPNLESQIRPLMEQLRVAPDEATGRALSGQLWELWATAPDEKSQQMLDHGMERRSAWDLRSAWDAFNELVTYCPEYAEGYNQRAFVAYLRQDFQTALVDLDRTLALDPDHIAALAGKALTLMGLGRGDEAQDVLRAALVLNPWLPERGLLIEPEGEDI